MSSRRHPDTDDIVYELVPDDSSEACVDDRLCDAQNVKFINEPHEPWQSYLKNVVEGNTIQTLTVLLIIANAVCVGLETDLPGLAYWDVVERIFLVFFTCELLLRISAVGIVTFFDCNNQDIFWNIIDVVVVSTGLLATAALMVTSDRHSIGNVTLFRSIRIIRILRILRVVRIFRFLKQLYLLAYGFVEGAMAVFWVAVLASCIIYVCAVVLVRVYRQEDNEFLRTRFQSVPTTMFTLFEIMCSPSLELYRSEIGEYPLLVAFIIVYVIFGSFGINGLLTGVISESILEKNQARVESQRLERELKRRDLCLRASDVFDTMDANQTGSLAVEDILVFADDIRALFIEACVSLPDYDFGHMFDLMDYDDNGFIEKPEFVSGILELCDDIRPMSIMELQSQLSRCSSKISRCSVTVEAVAQSLDTLNRSFASRHSEAMRASDLVTKACELLESRDKPEESSERLQNLEATIDQMRHMIVDYSKSALAEASVNAIASPRFLTAATDQSKVGHRRQRHPTLSRQGSSSNASVATAKSSASARPSLTMPDSPQQSKSPRISIRKKTSRFKDRAKYLSNGPKASEAVDDNVTELHKELRSRMTQACFDFKDDLTIEEARMRKPIATVEERLEFISRGTAGVQRTDVRSPRNIYFADDSHKLLNPIEESTTPQRRSKLIVSTPDTQHTEPSYPGGSHLLSAHRDLLCSEMNMPIPEFGKSHTSCKTSSMVFDSSKHRPQTDSALLEPVVEGPFRAAAKRAIDQHRQVYS